jgi:hypothetical protein
MRLARRERKRKITTVCDGQKAAYEPGRIALKDFKAALHNRLFKSSKLCKMIGKALENRRRFVNIESGHDACCASRVETKTAVSLRSNYADKSQGVICARCHNIFRMRLSASCGSIPREKKPEHDTVSKVIIMSPSTEGTAWRERCTVLQLSLAGPPAEQLRSFCRRRSEYLHPPGDPTLQTAWRCRSSR